MLITGLNDQGHKNNEPDPLDVRRMAKSSPHIWIENYAIGSFNKVRFQKKFIKPIYAMMADIFWKWWVPVKMWCRCCLLVAAGAKITFGIILAFEDI